MSSDSDDEALCNNENGRYFLYLLERDRIEKFRRYQEIATQEIAIRDSLEKARLTRESLEKARLTRDSQRATNLVSQNQNKGVNIIFDDIHFPPLCKNNF